MMPAIETFGEPLPVNVGPAAAPVVCAGLGLAALGGGGLAMADAVERNTAAFTGVGV